MTMVASPTDFREAFFRRYSPNCASQIVNVLDRSGPLSRALCEKEFPSGNFGVTQGVNRWQYIDEGLRTTVFDGGVVVESRDFSEAKLLLGDEKVNSFTLLRSDEVGLVLCKVKHQSPMPNIALVRNYMTACGFAYVPIFPIPYYLEARYGDNVPKDDLKALFVVRYWIDGEDETAASIEKADVIVLTHDGKSIFCKVCDLYEYAATAIVSTPPYVHGQDLPLAFRTSEPAPISETETENLPMSLRDKEES